MLEVWARSDGSLLNGEGGGGVFIVSAQNLTVTHNLPNSVGPNGETWSDRYGSKCER